MFDYVYLSLKSMSCYGEKLKYANLQAWAWKMRYTRCKPPGICVEELYGWESIFSKANGMVLEGADTIQG